MTGGMFSYAYSIDLYDCYKLTETEYMYLGFVNMHKFSKGSPLASILTAEKYMAHNDRLKEETGLI